MHLGKTQGRKERRATWGRKQAEKEVQGFRQVGMGAYQEKIKVIVDGETFIQVWHNIRAGAKRKHS